MNKKRIFFLLFSLLSVCPLAAHAQTVNKRRVAPAWMTTPWNDVAQATRYAKIRQSIEAQISKGVAPEAIMKRYDDPQKFRDAPMVFAYAVASYERAQRGNFSDSAMQPPPKPAGQPNPSALQRLERLDDWKVWPNTAETARIRFLWNARDQGFGSMVPVARRVVQKFPREFEVKWFAWHALYYGEQGIDAPLLLRWADELQKSQANKPGIGILKPLVYYGIWGREKTAATEKRAIAGFQGFLKNAPPDDPKRQMAEIKLRLIPARKQIWAKKARTGNR